MELPPHDSGPTLVCSRTCWTWMQDWWDLLWSYQCWMICKFIWRSVLMTELSCIPLSFSSREMTLLALSAAYLPTPTTVCTSSSLRTSASAESHNYKKTVGVFPGKVSLVTNGLWDFCQKTSHNHKYIRYIKKGGLQVWLSLFLLLLTISAWICPQNSRNLRPAF